MPPHSLDAPNVSPKLQDGGVLSIDEARAEVLAAVTPLPAEEVALADAQGRVLAEDLTTPHATPPFDTTAMDGFAVRAGDAGRRLRVVGESRAGAPHEGPALQDGEAIRISTGAALPAGADGVLQVELVDDDGDHVVLRDPVAAGRNVRRAGEDTQAGATVLRAGASLGPAELGVAANAGHARFAVARRPRVVVLGTGDELVPPGEPLGPGQVHDANTTTLAALARDEGARVTTRRVPDDRAATEAAIAQALDEADLLLLSGGVSVGPHDHVKPALEAQGVVERFWRVALRPGKPTWCGSARDGTLVLGLPGNPVSALVTAVLFARPALRAMQGARPLPRPGRARLGTAIARNPQRDECVRVRLDDDGVAHPTGPQGSHVLTSMLGADALALVPRGEGELAAGAAVELLPL
ncbi:gephyrin-like molybdotransferase Glp [Conexibacter sp. SYSU D00693]|uniref:molybdopterin molybdotransferase MoeA n=1 Tax=Conexibacter sp. SYSU D00693 TaxID=2812560 RepID=UPI00196A2973|nr:gephyrin-like molybdotransferase Glp [Conexibacter sp. SYSU D00693]